MFKTWEWWSNLSNIAFAITGSQNISDHFDKILFVVIIVDFCSYLNDINWKNRFAASTSKFKYSISSIISSLCLVKAFSRCSNRFSWSDFFNWLISSCLNWWELNCTLNMSVFVQNYIDISILLLNCFSFKYTPFKKEYIK